MPRRHGPNGRSDFYSALRISTIYLAASTAWILLSDRVVALWLSEDDFQRLQWLQTVKGLIFVSATAALIFALVIRRLRQVRDAQADVKQTQARLEAFADNLPGVAYVKDRAGRYVFVRGQPLHDGISLNDLLHRTDREVFDTALADRVTGHDRTLFETGQLSQIIETTRFGDEEQHWLVLRFPLTGADGERWLGGIAIDVTERHRAAARIRELVQELEQANRMKDQFLSNLSHELRTPITAIRLWTEVLRTTTPEDADTIREAAAMIRHSAVTQTLLIEDLLDVTRIIGGRLKMDMKPMRLAEVVRRTAELLQPMAAERQVAVQTAIPEEDCFMEGDARRVQQVVWNLLTNAIKFSRGGDTVQCKLDRDGEEWRLTVTDHGVGIRPDQVPHVFDRFKEIVSKQVRPEGGVGIGLSIVKHLVEAHHGTVSAESDGENKGSTFTVRFPAATPATPRRVRSVDDAPPKKNVKQLATRRILLVEDNADSRTGLALLMGRAGASVVQCETVDEALAAGEPFDLLLSDIGLPGRDGCELVRELRRRPEWQRRPAIALSAFAMPEDKTRAIESGFDEFVVKPVDAAQLIQLLADRINAASNAVAKP